MHNLRQLAESFLASAGYHFLQQKDDFFVADRLGLGGLRDTWLVWVPQRLNLPEDYRRAESGLLGEFNIYIPNYPNARYFVLTPSVGSFTKAFRSDASRLGVTLTVPILFFDSPYKRELATDYKSAISSLIENNPSKMRVPQPFTDPSAEPVSETGEDLLTELLEEISNHSDPCLRIVVGPAGIGKSVLFNAVFNNLYDRFHQAKAKRQVFCRPVPLLPAHLRRTASVRARAVIEEFLRSDVAAPVPAATFEWMLCNRYSTWLFDGLDELYAGDPEFFSNLLDLFTRSDSQAQVLLCARESLITSSSAFADFLEEFAGSAEGAVRIYRLENWQRKSKRAFGWLQFEGRLPKSDERDTEKVTHFLQWTDGSQSHKALSAVPYYCGLMLEGFEQGRTNEVETDFALIDHSVTSIIDREADKGLISAEVFQPNGLAEWLEEVAFHHYVSGYRGVSASDIAVFAKLVLAEDLPPESQENAVTSLVQFPVFKKGPEIGTVSFEHELVCEYLAARFIMRRFSSDPEWAARSLSGRIDLSNSLMLRYLAAHLPNQPGARTAIVDTLRRGVLRGHAFASLLQVLLLAYPDRDLIKVQALDFEGRDLSHVQFVDRDLAGVSFRNSNLSSTNFVRCNFQKSHFEGAYLIGTSFCDLPELALQDAVFGNLMRFSFIYVNGKKVEDLAAGTKWIERMTNISHEMKQPCPAAQQLRTLYMKFISLDGSSKRDELWEKDLLCGRRIVGAPSSKDCLDAARRFGFIRPAERPRRLRRAAGERYGEMVQFVSSLQMSESLRQLLDSICDQTRCEHVPSVVSLSK